MATKEGKLFPGFDQSVADNESTQFSNFNLNKTHQSSNSFSFDHAYSKLKNDKKYGKNKIAAILQHDTHFLQYKSLLIAATLKLSGHTVTDSNNQGLTKSWNKSTKNLYLKSLKKNLFNESEEEDELQKRWMKSDNSDAAKKNSSTLSLHIAAYENCDKIDKDLSKKSNAFKLGKSEFEQDQDSFEFPRQMSDKEHSAAPQIMQFKASQKLVSPNEDDAQSRQGEPPARGMTKLEVHMEALLMNDEEAQVLRDRVKLHRRQRAAASHQQILKNVAKHALSLTPPRSKPKIPSHMIPVDDASASYMPREMIYTNPKKSTKKKQQPPQKIEHQESKSPKSNNEGMPVTQIGVMKSHHPKPLSPIANSPPGRNSVPPLQGYNEWKIKQSKKKLPKTWKQTDTPPTEDEEETKIELPESLTEREEMVQDAQRKNDDCEQLIPVDPSRSFEKFHLFPTPLSSSVSDSRVSAVLVPSSDASTDLSSHYTSTLSSSASNSSTTKSRSKSHEPLSPPCLIVPKTINALAANNIGKVYITDKLSDLDKLVLATAFSPVPVQQKPPKHAGKSKSDFALHKKHRSPFKSLFKRFDPLKRTQSLQPLSQPRQSSTSSFPPERNIDVCKQYEIVKAVRFPNTWIDEMEAIAIIAFLLAVIALLIYRSILIEVL